MLFTSAQGSYLCFLLAVSLWVPELYRCSDVYNIQCPHFYQLPQSSKHQTLGLSSSFRGLVAAFSRSVHAVANVHGSYFSFLLVVRLSVPELSRKIIMPLGGEHIVVVGSETPHLTVFPYALEA